MILVGKLYYISEVGITSKILNSVTDLERSHEFLLFYYTIHSCLRSKSITLLRIFDVIPTSGFKVKGV